MIYLIFISFISFNLQINSLWQNDYDDPDLKLQTHLNSSIYADSDVKIS